MKFSIRVAEHCNLNCKGCNNFSPIAEPEFADLNELKRDLARLSDLFDHKASFIDFNGGEALLHPELISIMKMTREAFPEAELFILSNAILLPKQSDEFWRACSDNRVSIRCSAYPIRIDLDKIRAKAQEFGVKFEWLWDEKESQRNEFLIEPINLAGNSSVKMNFAMCGRANNCIYLSHGRMYTCSFAATVRHFNKFFGKSIAITDADSINIYEENITGDEILRRLAEPIPICRYCNLHARNVQWGISKKEISEWM